MGLNRFVEENVEEFTWGVVLGLGFILVSYWLPLLCGLLWRLGGSGWLGTKAWRRFGVPLAIASFTFTSLTLASLLGASAISVGILCIGYGTRSTQPFDPGSPLGNWWLDFVRAELPNEPAELTEFLSKLGSRSTIIVSIWAVWATAYAIALHLK